jgi:predicted nucleic acid-binding protein
MRRGKVVDLDADLAVAAADLSADLKLALADSIILATAREFEATVWTQDIDFEGPEGVEYRAHQG